MKANRGPAQSVIAASLLGLVSGSLIGCTNPSSNGDATNVSMRSEEDTELDSVAVTVGEMVGNVKYVFLLAISR